MSFNDILNNVGADAFLSSGNESEEERKGPAMYSGVRVFRPNLTASSRPEPSQQQEVSTEAHSELEKEFHEHLSRPSEQQPPTESDSDTAPCAAEVDEVEETPEEKKMRELLNLAESARMASTEDELGARRIQSAKPKPTAKLSEKKQDSAEESSDDD